MSFEVFTKAPCRQKHIRLLLSENLIWIRILSERFVQLSLVSLPQAKLKTSFLKAIFLLFGFCMTAWFDGYRRVTICFSEVIVTK